MGNLAQSGQVKEEEGNDAEEEWADPVSPHQLVVVIEVAICVWIL